MKNIFAITALLLWSACLYAQTQAPAGSADQVAMTVGQRKITASELCRAIESLPPPQRKGYALHPNLAAQWFGPLEAMAEEASREHLVVRTNARENEVDIDNALVGELIQAIARNTQPTNAEIERYYASHKSEFEQALVRHILISHATAFASRSQRSEAEAKAKAEKIASQLKQGGDFRTIATQQSDDPYTKEKGGDLGYVSHYQLEPAVDNTVWALAAGQISAPFKGRFGYEIVEVENKRVQPLEAVREIIVGKIRAAVLESRQQEIVQAAHVTLEPSFANSPLPCEASRPFTLKNSLGAP